MHNSPPDSSTSLNHAPDGHDPFTSAREVESAAAKAAKEHRLADELERTSPLPRHLRIQERMLRKAYQRLAVESEPLLPPAAEWFLDNFHVVQEALRQIREDMPHGFYRQLPTVRLASDQSCPRIRAVAREIIRFSGDYLVFDQVRHFVHTYQGITDLTMGELWALPTMLRLGILEDLTQAVLRFPGLQAQGDTEPPSPTDVAEEQTIANCILSLRGLGAHDWEAFFESVSQVEQVLRSDPADAYTHMDFQTRDRYRQVVEELAMATGLSEKRIAREAIRAAQDARGDSPRSGHVGFHLLGEGRSALEAHLGYRPTLTEHVRRWLLGHPSLAYLGGIGLGTAAVLGAAIGYASWAGGTLLQRVGVGLTVLVPSTAVVCQAMNWIIMRVLPPRRLPRMDYDEGIPAESRTVVVIPALLSSPDEVEGLLRQLELHYLGNNDPNLLFALLTDFADAPREHMSNDQDLIDQATAGINALNERYGDRSNSPFLLFHRERQWSSAEACWMGWERKRGKLADFDRLLCGDNTENHFTVQEPSPHALQGIKYAITLDRDTVLPRGSARQLVATLAHPLNHAKFDPEGGTVVAGYTVLQPRLEVWPTAANRSPFTRIYAGDATVDLYTRAVSDVYQDLFGEGIYAGKGVYDVAAFEQSLAGRVPANALLSHDLFEGIHGRAALCTDVTLFEDYPPHYLAYAVRQHRWIRGDWQLLPWLLPRVPGSGGKTIPSALSIIDKWKILDNLRRSLLTPSLLALLLAGWLWLPGLPLLWTLIALLTPAVALIPQVARRLLRRRRPVTDAVMQPLSAQAARWLLGLVFLAYESLLTLDAIGCTLVRLLITHKHLLQWTTAAHTIRLFGRQRKLTLLWTRMRGAPALAVGIGLLLAWARPLVLPVAAPLLLAWLASPQIAYWISRPLVHEQSPLSAERLQQLRCVARRTWLYFEQFVGPDDHWLPPDHYQEHPLGRLARRTSPTNIGMLLLSTLAAYDLGYIGSTDLASRLLFTLDNVQQMERYRGHCFNWYDTRTLRPLPPRYVSTVDSGNLAGCLLALRQGCLNLLQDPLLRWQQWEGLLDALSILSQTLQQLQEPEPKPDTSSLQGLVDHMRQQTLAVRDQPSCWRSLLTKLRQDDWQEVKAGLQLLLKAQADVLDVETVRDLRIWSGRVSNHLQSTARGLDDLLPWLRFLSDPPTLFAQSEMPAALRDAWQALVKALPVAPGLAAVPQACRHGVACLDKLEVLLTGSTKRGMQLQQALSWCVGLSGALCAAQERAESLVVDYRNVAAKAATYVQDMDFAFLFDTRRQIFHIGYNVTAGRMDKNYYDLLASEARLASLLAIAMGHVPKSHWLHLGRSFTRTDGTRTLLSWSGTMFEYLMPCLLIPSYPGTLLYQASDAAIDRQIAYARKQDVPWGISESGYYHFDANRSYQYKAFGVPGLGFKRGLSKDLVISPYASLLALSLRPNAVMDNVAELTKHGLIGRHGFYEAVDYTASRMPSGQKSAIVRSYMAHHQGMILLSITNYLQNQVMVHRFHADPRIQSADLLLHEQIPLQAPVEYAYPQETLSVRPAPRPPTDTPWRASMQVPIPQVHLLSNGSYSVLISSAGGGYSQWKGVSLTRWRADTTLDSWGTWIYVEDTRRKALWSAGYQPTAATPQQEEVLFYAHKVEFRRKDHGISLRMEITVSPDHDAEVRRITLTNEGNRRRRLWVTSYGEITLAPQAVDSRHPAFSKLFVESEYVQKLNTLLFRRRPRSANEEPVYLAHLLVTRGQSKVTGAYETDRARFLGRGHTAHCPASLGNSGSRLAGTTGATLDPIMCIGQSIDLRGHQTVQLAYVTLAAESREDALALARHYQAWLMVRRAFGRARDHYGRELHQFDLSTPELQRFQQLLSLLLYPHRALRADPAALAANCQGQSGLWPYAISGDYPILLVCIHSREEAELLYELLRAHAYWRRRELKVDLVILNERETGYADELHGYVHRLVTRTGGDTWLNRRGGIFVLRADQLGDEGRALLETAARAILHGDQGSLADQLVRLRHQPARLPDLVPTLVGKGALESAKPTVPLKRPGNLLFDNGLGGFSPDGREYVIYLKPNQWTPRPWINVIGNPDFGFLVSEAGSGYTWAENSGENRLTPWQNDPVSDTPGEALYLRDEETGHIWSPTRLPAGAPAPYLVRHGAGYSVFQHHSHGLKQRLRLFAVREAPVKVIQLQLENSSNRPRRITATYYAEWVLGTSREATQQYIAPEFDASHNALLARNTYSDEFRERVAFLAASQEIHGLTCDRTEFLGREGNMARPAALSRLGLSGKVEAGLDPCAALQIHIDLAPGESRQVFFLLGQGAERQEALQLIKQYQDSSQIEAAWNASIGFWDSLLDTVQVQTPEPAMNLLLNRWLLYQTLSCRIWARSALYQSSGAFGFRDQLQDVMALTHAAPHLTRAHILDAACHQFEAGDVLHWWHPPSGRGVRTRYADDLLWLPFVTAHYVTHTGDLSILHEERPFRMGSPLDSEETERYGHYQTTAEAYDLYDHCCRALERGSTTGPHGLPLMGGGDWNDGMNRVGIKGQGESVWLGWFLCAALKSFAPLCELVGDKERAARYIETARQVSEALERYGWDGSWYRRAYYDDGTPMGSAENLECQIASIAQSWAVLSGGADPERAHKAMEAIYARLVRQQECLLLLFSPPFDKTKRDPGYIKGYPPGIRENGGQYTHAALWVVWAFAMLGQGDRAQALFRLLNPIHHSATPSQAARYEVEPYVIAADVYSHPAHLGRGGWTWYTGSAGWMYRVGLEAILGLRRLGSTLRIEPCIPKHWSSYTIDYRHGETLYHISVTNPNGVSRGVRQVTMDSERLPSGEIPLLQDGKRHKVQVQMG